MSSGPGAKSVTAAQKAKPHYGLDLIEEAPANVDDSSGEESSD